MVLTILPEALERGRVQQLKKTRTTEGICLFQYKRCRFKLGSFGSRTSSFPLHHGRLTKCIPELGMVLYTFNLSTLVGRGKQRKTDLYEFKVKQVYIVSSSTQLQVVNQILLGNHNLSSLCYIEID